MSVAFSKYEQNFKYFINTCKKSKMPFVPFELFDKIRSLLIIFDCFDIIISCPMQYRSN